MKLKPYTKGLLLTAAGAVGWGISGVCSQSLFASYTLSSDWLTAVRMLLSGILLLLLSLSKEKSGIFNVWKSKADIGWLLAFAIIGLLMCQYTFLSAIEYSNSATATVLQSLNVVIMAVFVALRDRIPLTRRQITAILLAVVGTYLMATGGKLGGLVLSPAGLIFGLLSAVGVVTYTLLSQPIIQKWGNMPVTGWGMLIGGIVLGTAVQVWNIPAGLDLTAWLLIAVIVVVGTAGGFSLFLQGVKYIGPGKATLIGCLEPIAATVLSYLFLNTRFGAVELIGFAAVLTTVVLSMGKEN